MSIITPNIIKDLPINLIILHFSLKILYLLLRYSQANELMGEWVNELMG